VPSTITHSGPDVHVSVGSTGALTGPVAGAGKYTDGDDHATPSHEMATPAPAVRAVPFPVVPPPEATHRVSEMQEREVKPPPGGRVVRARDHPGARGTVVGTVVGAADGPTVVVVDCWTPAESGGLR